MSGHEHERITADIYADMVDMETDTHKLSALARDAVTATDERCMLADAASTMPHEQRV